MESTNTMDNNYGRQTLPPVIKSEEKIEKYWGYIKTVFGKNDFTLKEVFMKSNTQSSMESVSYTHLTLPTNREL